MSRDIRETLVRSSYDGIAIICHVRPRQDVLANVARPSYDRRTTVVRRSCKCRTMVMRENDKHIKFLQCFNVFSTGIVSLSPGCIFFFFVSVVWETVETSELSSSETTEDFSASSDMGWGAGDAATLPLPLPLLPFDGMLKLSMCENCLRETYLFPGHVGRTHEPIATHMRRHCDTFTTLARRSWDIRASVSRRSHECRSVLFSRNLPAKLSSLFAIYSYLYRKFVALWPAETKLRWVCEWFAMGSRHMRWLCDCFARSFGHVQNFRKPFATSSRLLREYWEPLRAVHDSFETSSRTESQNSREQSHASEIGA